MLTQSLHIRLLIAATLVLAGFLGTAGVALHNAFLDSAEAALRDRLLGHVYALLAAAGEDQDGHMLLPMRLPDQRFSNPDSGLYALVVENNGRIHWRSPSLTGQSMDFVQPQPPGEREWHYWQNGDRELLVLNFGIAWEDYQGNKTPYTIAVAADNAPMLQEVQSFRTALWTWLGSLACILLLVQWVILHWGLRPLRTVAHDLLRIENGETENLAGSYPKELRGLTNNLNALIGNARAKQQRYRNSLDDLAHSLKTPLAILHNAVLETEDIRTLVDLVREQVQRMDSIVQHQLRRAAVAGHGALGRTVPVAPLVERLIRSLSKVYRDKAMQITLDLATDARFFGDEADLLEVLGNLVDNAFKYGHQRIHIHTRSFIDSGKQKPVLVLRIDDDGPGIDPSRLEELMQRGLRLDESIPGQGIGLAVARDIVTLYDGRMETKLSSLGGASVIVYWP